MIFLLEILRKYITGTLCISSRGGFAGAGFIMYICL